MGRCLTIIKFSGVTSLGLLTGSLAYQSWVGIPQLIRELNGATTASYKASLKAISDTFTVSNMVNLTLAALSTWLFSTAYKHASPVGKHPYLIYSALGAPLALLSLYYNGAKAQCSIRKRSRGNVACSKSACCSKLGGCVAKTKLFLGKTLNCASMKCNPEPTSTPAETQTEAETQTPAQAPVANQDEENLGLSYIHVSEDSLSTLTPNASVPGSPLPAVISESSASNASAIEEEVESALEKKAFVHDLETFKSGNGVASGIAAVALFISSIGVIGEQLYF